MTSENRGRDHCARDSDGFSRYRCRDHWRAREFRGVRFGGCHFHLALTRSDLCGSQREFRSNGTALCGSRREFRSNGTARRFLYTGRFYRSGDPRYHPCCGVVGEDVKIIQVCSNYFALRTYRIRDDTIVMVSRRKCT